MKWSEEAKKSLKEIPFFVRKRVTKRVEEEAARSGACEVLLEHVHACRRNFLTKMEEEVSGYKVESCFGPSGCPNRAVICEDLSEKIKERLTAGDIKSFLKKIVPGPLKIHHEFRVSISDCPNACSRPQITDIGLVGACQPAITKEGCSHCNACAEACREKAISFPGDAPVVDETKCLSCGQCIAVCPTGTLQAGKSGYRILLGGKLGRHPRLATELPGIFSGEDISGIVDSSLDYYTSYCKGGERLGEIMEKRGEETIRRKVIP